MTLTIEDLTVRYPGGLTAVDGLSLEVADGQLVALAGESGCGKSSLARALLGLLPESATVTGSARLEQVELAGRTDWSGLRGATIAIIPQGAMSGLNPVQPVATQLAEMIRLHTSLRGPAAADRARALLDRVRLAPRVLGAYPHELSGGMRQRVAIALALAGEPELIVADEPTTGLDAVTQEHILELLGEVRGRAGMLIISHDLSALVRIADRVAVMYAGRLAEVRPAHRLAEQAAHPYTIGLVTATASVEPSRPWGSVPGAAPPLDALPAGCRFAPRCPIAIDLCRTEQPPLLPHGAAQVACHRTGDPATPTYPTVPAADGASHHEVAAAGLRVTDVEQTYRTRRGAVRALCGVSLAIEPGQILGLVGESGSGKSTLARIILGLVRPAAGQVRVDGSELTRLRGSRLRAQQHRLGFVPQDPYSSLHPAMRVAGLVAEPLAVCRVPRGDRAGRLRSALAAAGLPTDADFLRRFPHQLSGGQRQRVALARALVNDPILLIADEATSMLDVSTRAGIATTLRSLATDRGLAVLFITHDLAEAVQSCNQIMVLREGVVVESGPPARLVGAPAHPYTTQLLAAAGHDAASTRIGDADC